MRYGNAGNGIVFTSMQNAIKSKEEVCCRRRIWLRDQLRGNAGNAIVFTSIPNAIKLKGEVWCQLACCPRRGFWFPEKLKSRSHVFGKVRLRDQLGCEVQNTIMSIGDVGNAIDFVGEGFGFKMRYHHIY
jgi:hypothetical protein